MTISSYTYDDYLDLIKSFHGHIAPGLIMGGIMVDIALKKIPPDILFDAICETHNCLPDAVQLLTPCTIGNGWLTLLPIGRFALTFYDKYNGHGVRVYVSPKAVARWDAINSWFFKLKPKKDQDTDRLMDEIRLAGPDLYQDEKIRIKPDYLKKRSMGTIAVCPICSEAYPAKHGRICSACQGNVPYLSQPKADAGDVFAYAECIPKIAVAESKGATALHDMTQIKPGRQKGPAIRQGQTITAGDICRLQQMGRQHVFIQDHQRISEDNLHENDVAKAFAAVMAGDGVAYTSEPSEGKIDFVAERSGLLLIDKARLEAFNLVPGVMCATRKNYSIVKRNRKLGGTRAIPLYLPKNEFLKAMDVLDGSPLLRVLALRKAKIGLLVTGTEVFQGLVEDQFIPIISRKVTKLGCQIVRSLIVPDDREAIHESVLDVIDSGADLIVTTAGLSVDPDDVTRLGLIDAGATDLLYGMPVLPGAMTLLANIGKIQIVGVPACALYYQTTSLDLLLPRLLAGLHITRQDLARFGNGAFCWGCKQCTFPKCAFGKD
ncbi:MAG: trehalose-binding protein [Desulfatitalea sp.]|nr:trehalose-binding protein [Desulfatitalea sp.]